MTVDVLPRADEETTGDAAPRVRVRDVAFWIFFVVYTLGGVLVLLQGAGAVWAHLSAHLHASLHLRALGSTGYAARIAQRMADASHRLPSVGSIVLGYAFSIFN